MHGPEFGGGVEVGALAELYVYGSRPKTEWGPLVCVPLFWDFENTQTMVALKLLVLSACLALAGAFAPMAAPLSGRAVAAATPAGSGIVMIRHANKLKKLNRPADQRKALLRGLTTELIRHGRIKTTTIRCKELRKTTDHMVTLAKDGSLHARRQVTHSSY